MRARWHKSYPEGSKSIRADLERSPIDPGKELPEDALSRSCRHIIDVLEPELDSWFIVKDYQDDVLML